MEFSIKEILHFLGGKKKKRIETVSCLFLKNLWQSSQKIK